MKTPFVTTAAIGLMAGSTAMAVEKSDVVATYADIAAAKYGDSLITAQRAYEMNSKVITASDEMLATVNTLR